LAVTETSLFSAKLTNALQKKLLAKKAVLQTLNDKPKSGLFFHLESRIPEGKKFAVTFFYSFDWFTNFKYIIFEQARTNF
jgi:hypothetical protein